MKNENSPQTQRHRLERSSMSKMEERANCVIGMGQQQSEDGLVNKKNWKDQHEKERTATRE
jgi:hypothetical protein